MPQKAKRPCLDRIIISPEKSSWKGFFDIFILALVGYSCIVSLYYVAFGTPSNTIHWIWDKMVEIFFVIDLLLNFITE